MLLQTKVVVTDKITFAYMMHEDEVISINNFTEKKWKCMYRKIEYVNFGE